MCVFSGKTMQMSYEEKCHYFLSKCQTQSTITVISERKQQQNIGHATSKNVIRCFHKHRFVFEEGLKQMQLNEPGGKEKAEFLAEGEACKLIS